MSGIVRTIKAKMEEHHISVHALEKKAGLKPSAIHNILYGRSKKPSINVIHSIAVALDCSVSEILGDSPQPYKDFSKSEENDLEWDPELYLKSFRTVLGLAKDTKIKMMKSSFLEVVEEIYNYSLKYENKKDIDEKFSEWIFEKTIKTIDEE